jgi:hypothetical protein
VVMLLREGDPVKDSQGVEMEARHLPQCWQWLRNYGQHERSSSGSHGPASDRGKVSWRGGRQMCAEIWQERPQLEKSGRWVRRVG